MTKPVVLAAVAHPDDIEFMMAGTLLRLKAAGAEIHLWNLANGCCGTAEHDREEITDLRWKETLASARVAGGTAHPPLADDIGLFYTPALLAAAATVIRRVRPTIVLTQSPQDYMEDHQNACRLVVSATFVRGMRNFSSSPAVAPYEGECVIYHALPHGLRDGLRKRIRSGLYVDIGSVLPTKRAMLACHATQKRWLDVSQGMDAYLTEMETMSAAVGAQSGRFVFAEGWRRHSHLAFSAEGRDPMRDLLGEDCFIDAEYERSLDEP